MTEKKVMLNQNNQRTVHLDNVESQALLVALKSSTFYQTWCDRAALFWKELQFVFTARQPFVGFVK